MNKEVRIKVRLDKDKIPEEIIWDADDLNSEPVPVRAMLLSMWDHAGKDTLRLDLWTKDMTRDEMAIFFL